MKRCMTAFVARNVAAVHPDARKVVDCAEMKNDATVGLRQVEVALVPACRVERRIRDAARLRFRGEGHVDRQRPLVDLRRVRVAPLAIERKAPVAVEAQPMRPLELRPGISRRAGLHETTSGTFAAVSENSG